eukprot:CAMPEP_0182854476 /NCGR_PEP_ID=MMETSP0034_2-20130328/1278_1 /TAXON_ID=156128 /ORGANISM="Nephroselmis pyriformis, Strain CCMP717" /LENGTH=367 /DNA_ID=CAMNT_0024985309 /DNA_START=1 /DNA_END=1104 /DNA_ORIENTATION=-
MPHGVGPGRQHVGSWRGQGGGSHESVAPPHGGDGDAAPGHWQGWPNKLQQQHPAPPAANALHPQGVPLLGRGYNSSEAISPAIHGAGGGGAPIVPRSQDSAASGAGGADPSDTIKVVVRVRPISAAEVARGEDAAVHVAPTGRDMEVHCRSFRRNFQFHACLGPEVTQSQLIAACGVGQLLEAAMAGYSSTVFAYGQTGAGKTYSLTGKEEELAGESYKGGEHDGLLPRALVHLFRLVAARPSAQYKIRLSYLEIYNEQCYDLLAGNKVALPVKYDSTHGFYAKGLLWEECNGPGDALRLISSGTRHRRVGSHALNADSSRSHSMINVQIEATTIAGDGYPRTTFGKAAFVDLAGSERVKSTLSAGE